ncbi:MAG: phosphoribosyltransferase, partial [Bacteroidota bacterium]
WKIKKTKFGFTEKMLKIKLSDIDSLAKRLTDKILQDQYVPDAIIYVEKAGFLLAEAIARNLQCYTLIRCEARRPLSSMKKKSSLIIAHMPDWLILLLRKMEVNFKLYKSSNERYVKVHGKIVPLKKYLIVDDSLDTGYSLKEVIKKLTDIGLKAKNYRIAVINILSEEKLNPVVLPDYYLYKNIHIQYPWSSDSVDYESYLRIYTELKKTYRQ